LNWGHARFGVGYQDLLDLNITTTKKLAEWMQGRGADDDRIRVMYTGVRLAQSTIEDRQRVRAELCIPVDVPIIVFAGRICEQKRPAMLAEVLKNLREQGLIFRALIIGDGELKHQLEKMLGEYQLHGHVQMLGSVAHARWLEILAASDILLMPSKYEGISVALLEAVAGGVVPVVAKVGGQDEIVGADAGVLIPHSENELQEYVKAIRCLLSDPSGLLQMSSQCKALATSQLSWEGMNDKFLEILDEAHQLRLNSPRNLVTSQVGRELATLALECKRLGEAVDWLWNSKSHNTASSTAEFELLSTSKETHAAARLAIVLSQTWLGRKLICNRLCQAVGRLVMRRFGKPSLA
jgi:glycosyltransferase involved in cell wall biosynthesis